MDGRSNFDLGYWMGSAEQRLKALEAGQASLRADLKALRHELRTALRLARRLGLLALLWTGAIGLNVAPDATADLAFKALGIVLKGG